MTWTDYIPHGLLTTAVAAIAWVGRSHIAFDKKTRERVEKIEVNVAALPSKSDLDRVHDRIDELGRQISDGQREILTAIALPRGPRFPQ